MSNQRKEANQGILAWWEISNLAFHHGTFQVHMNDYAQSKSRRGHHYRNTTIVFYQALQALICPHVTCCLWVVAIPRPPNYQSKRLTFRPSLRGQLVGNPGGNSLSTTLHISPKTPSDNTLMSNQRKEANQGISHGGRSPISHSTMALSKCTWMTMHSPNPVGVTTVECRYTYKSTCVNPYMFIARR